MVVNELNAHVLGSLVPSLPCSGTRNWSCAGVESLVIFSHVRSAKGKRGGRETLIEHGRTRDSEQEKERRYQPTYYMYPVIEGKISYTPNVERIVGWTTRKTLPFRFSPILITSCLRRKKYQALHACTTCIPESLGTRLCFGNIRM